MIAVMLVLVLHVLSITANTGLRSWDYHCYEDAARALVDGNNPYAGGCYLYPPSLAQALSVGYKVLHRLWPSPSSSYDTWWLVFFCYQAFQFYLFAIAVWLCIKLGEQALGKDLWVAVGVGAILLISEPLVRTIRFQQANLVSMCALAYVLMGMATNKTRIGVVLAMSVFIKPHLLLAPLAFVAWRRWHSLAGFAVASLVILGASLSTESGRVLYANHVSSFHTIMAYSASLHNQSLLSVVWNISRMAGSRPNGTLAALVVQGLYYGAIAWIVLRIGRRVLASRGTEGLGVNDFGVTLTDLVMLFLILSPLAWPHSYVVVIPLLIWSFGAYPQSRRLLAIAGFLMLVPVTFEVFPLSYHRLAGAVLFLLATGRRGWGSPMWRAKSMHSEVNTRQQTLDGSAQRMELKVL